MPQRNGHASLVAGEKKTDVRENEQDTRERRTTQEQQTSNKQQTLFCFYNLFGLAFSYVTPASCREIKNSTSKRKHKHQRERPTPEIETQEEIARTTQEVEPWLSCTLTLTT
jgi:hypothetical protein